MVALKSACDFIVAVKFFLVVLLPSARNDSLWCFIQYTIGQMVALLSCCYNFLIGLALFFVFSRVSSSPLEDIGWVVSTKNQLVVLLFCVAMWLIPLHDHQWGLMSPTTGDCWIPDSDSTPGHNIYRLTFFVPLAIFNLLTIRLLVLVYRRRRLFQLENRFLLLRLVVFVLLFLLQWACYFAAAIIEFVRVEDMYDDHGVVVTFYATIISSAGLLNWLVWSTRPGCIYKTFFCCFQDRQSWYTSTDDVGKSRLVTESPSPSQHREPLLQSSPCDLLVGDQHNDIRMYSPAGGIDFDNSILSPSALDNSLESGTPREQWILENMRQDVLNKAKNAEVSLLSDDSEWDRV